jgi:outer membrane protein TolC
MKKTSYILSVLISILLNIGLASAQPITLKDALAKSLSNYGTVKAKENYVNASRASVQQSKRDYLPNIVLSAQQDYGTINGQNGPLYGYGGFGTASSGAALNDQNWNAAFGALYLANLNWEFFTFGRSRGKIKIAEAALNRDEADLEQEQFQLQVKAASAYLNLIAAQRITRSQRKNLERAVTFKNTATARAKNGLIPGVDSSQANAEISNAKIALTRALDTEQEQAGKLSVLLGIPATEFILDTTFITRIPLSINSAAVKSKSHPMLNYYQSRINLSNDQENYYRKFYYPSLSLFGVVQDRGSGFETAYSLDQTAFNQNYVKGITPVRSNYLVGVGLTWNLTTIVRTNAQVRAQSFLTQAMQDEYELADQQLNAQILLADSKIKNAIDNYNEAPVQMKAAADAFNQKNALYKNGLTTITDLTQALYLLNRAETDRDIAYSNVWQALLIKAAATGDFTIFTNEL